jgi:hypothetical protein
VKAAALEEVRATFGLTKNELADLFHRRAQSVAEWYQRGIPQEQAATAGRLVDLARLFRRRLIPERIPEIVRTPDEWLGNRSILQVLSSPDGIDAVYAYLGRLFSYGGA